MKLKRLIESVNKKSHPLEEKDWAHIYQLTNQGKLFISFIVKLEAGLAKETLQLTLICYT
ncbi:MAG: hypothetical protein CVU14_09160 [Bacteroidetes bacterium HGW-Bacteroidetes-9]|jgi:hypothetical protein|nr:MAG: hypothetical protein CVU14_09160 [Bacteroidetes bacterium HGW-Bacteroidetes-9]